MAPTVVAEGPEGVSYISLIAEGGVISLRVRDAGAEFQQIQDEQLVEEVRSRLTPDTPVVIAADGKVPYETVMKTMDRLRSSGITRLGLLVDQKSSNDTAAN